MPTEEQIKQLAHSLWEQEGRPEGRDMEHYLAAKQILEERRAVKGRAKTSRKPKTRTHSPRAKK